MNAQDDNALPPRTGVRRLISRWEYRHLRAFARGRFAAAAGLAFFGVVILSTGSYGWAGVFLVLAALQFAAACWDITIARSASA